MHYILAELLFLEQIGSCAMCGTKLPTLPEGTFDDRMFCGGDCTLLALHAGNEELVA
jgi:hypothetical protein